MLPRLAPCHTNYRSLKKSNLFEYLNRVVSRMLV